MRARIEQEYFLTSSLDFRNCDESTFSNSNASSIYARYTLRPVIIIIRRGFVENEANLFVLNFGIQ